MSKRNSQLCGRLQQEAIQLSPRPIKVTEEEEKKEEKKEEEEKNDEDGPNQVLSVGRTLSRWGALPFRCS